MANFDARHQRMGIITQDHGGIDGIDTRLGAFTVFAKLVELDGSATIIQPACPPPDPVAGADGYRNPLTDDGSPGNGKWGPARTDQGVDWISNEPLPVQAIGAGVITYSSTSSGWPGGAFITYQLTAGTHAGLHIYVAEHLTNLLPTGAVVTPGQVIATALPGSPWTEWGWAAPQGTSPAVRYNGAPDGTPMEGGKAFARFLRELGAQPREDPGPGPDRPPEGTS